MGRKKEKTEEPVKQISTDTELAGIIKDTINSGFKGFKVASFLNSDDNIASQIELWLQSGSTMLDLAISNRPNGGYPFGRIIEIYGPNSSGKTLLAVTALREVQKMGGIGVFIDSESSVSHDFLSAIGVNLDTLVYTQLDTIEDIFQTVENIINKVREKNKNTPVAIVVDSIMGASTKVEMESDWDKDGFATTKAIVMGKAMRKVTNLIAKEKVLLICVNQMRQKMGVSFGETDATAGGSALGFHASVRIRTKTVGKIKVGDDVVGVQANCTIKKNRVGPPFREASFNIYFNSGIDDSGHWFEKLVDFGLISKVNNRTYTYTIENTGEVLEFSEKQWRELLNSNTALRESAYKQLCDKCIMKYRHEEADSESINIVEAKEEE